MMYFENVKNLEELKKVYRELAMKHHPDRGGNLETMQAINNEYDILFAQLKEAEQQEDNYRQIIDELIKYDLTVEIIGTWIWVSGDTYSIKDTLKQLGMKWAKNKKAWYWHPGEYQRRTKKQFSLDDIRGMHNSKTIKTTSNPKFRPRLV